MTPAVSVVVAAYNYGRYLAGALDSVLAQTFTDLEVVVVDDGSTDETGEVIRPYLADPRVRYYRTNHLGQPAAKNTGIRLCRAPRIAFLDADDLWLPDKLALQLEHLGRFPAVGLVTGGEWQEFGDGRPSWRLDRPAYGARRLEREVLRENCLGNPSLVLVRRTCFAAAGVFDEAIPLGLDWDMWIRLTRVCPVGCVGAPLIRYRHHPGSLSDGRIWERFAANRECFRRYIGPLRPWWRRLALLSAAQSMNCYYAGSGVIDQEGQRLLGIGLALGALTLDPTYKRRDKAALLLRATGGRRLVNRIRPVRRGAH
jgi:glycosyltransferase involved in cell wall biosynthesis